MGNTVGSIEEYKRELLELLRAEPKSHIDIAKCYTKLGNAYSEHEKHRLALNNYEGALNALLGAYPNDKNHREIADCYSAIGLEYLYLRMNGKATRAFNDAYYIREKICDPSDPAIADTQLYMAYLCVVTNWNYFAQENLDDALKIYEIAYKDEPNHPRFADVCSTRGLSYMIDREFSKAVECYERALEMRASGKDTLENKLGIAMIYNNLGSVYTYMAEFNDDAEQAKKHFETAIKYAKKSLKVKLETYGSENHALVALSYTNLAYTYKRSGQKRMAIELYKRALDIYSLSYKDEPSHPAIIDICESLADIYRDLFDKKTAEEYETRALNLKRRAQE